ncbi:hypothetical protein [Basilea psittacipulmonis]|uniref:Uncharacterized protein n=1 Tax=Basilea psittacipulmonis DSM 24701 TaxID=1072685 RepID=A0A077DD68_9BURK|nr:hypothetical protein [Basilea psittacipulmonis]AIL32775.1 hypothetical protein IX83_05135 [Basilea psittacipulmonis DSM 24701]
MIEQTWGYEHPEVKGPKALLFFTWDLSRTIDNAFRNTTPDQLDDSLKTAQAGIDELLKKYVEIQADPDTFEGQSIRLQMSETEDTHEPVIALQTSPELEQKIIELKHYASQGHA